MDGKFLADVVQNTVFLVLSVVAFGLELWAFVDCLRHRPGAFEAASKRTKTFWLALTGIAALIGGLSLWSGGGGLGLFGIVAVTVAGVYLADVRPAVSESGRGGSRNIGPYGPW